MRVSFISVGGSDITKPCCAAAVARQAVCAALLRSLGLAGSTLDLQEEKSRDQSINPVSLLPCSEEILRSMEGQLMVSTFKHSPPILHPLQFCSF
ncbi:hypothetical protein SKAU_G00010220 [Synaphobranchus kaupii]|uniref:Uncharacterized protein n=1 Tax=Synaphobranchus kaupii TaxID=118154 RepID=A0A9Q1GB11_SYNKA|nr:hypothetical protein SKAU_G00010220 [Synaphobranchus kaupii]